MKSLLSYLWITLLLFIGFDPNIGVKLQGSSSATLAIPTPTITPIPARDLDLLPTFEAVITSEYEDCSIPCWWGFKPGETTLDEIVDFVKRTNFDRQWKTSYSESLTLEEYLRLGERIVLDFLPSNYDMAANVEIGFGFENDRLALTSVRITEPNEWLVPEANLVGLPQIFASTQEIPEIYVSTGPNMLKSQYTIIVVYRERNSQLTYTFDLTEDHGVRTPLQRLCLNLEHTIRIAMNLSHLDSGVKEYPPDMVGFDTPEDIFGINTEDFVQFFRENPDECLDVSEYKAEQ